MSATIQAVTKALQMGPGPGPQVDLVAKPLTNLVGSAVGAFLTTLVLGAILVVVVPDYTERKMATLLDEPVGSFLYGLAAAVFLLLVNVVLALTIIGILVAALLTRALYGAVWAVGAAIAFLAIGERLVGQEEGWAKPLIVGATINGAVTLTGVGALLTFAVGAAGFGAVLRDFLN